VLGESHPNRKIGTQNSTTDYTHNTDDGFAGALASDAGFGALAETIFDLNHESTRIDTKGNRDHGGFDIMNRIF